jgi:hypothetical protein
MITVMFIVLAGMAGYAVGRLHSDRLWRDYAETSTPHVCRGEWYWVRKEKG